MQKLSVDLFILVCNSRKNDCTMLDGFLWVAVTYVGHSESPVMTKMELLKLVYRSTGFTAILIDVSCSGSGEGAMSSISERWNIEFVRVKRTQQMLLENSRNTCISACARALVTQSIASSCMTCLTSPVIQTISLCSRTKRVLRRDTRR